MPRSLRNPSRTRTTGLMPLAAQCTLIAALLAPACGAAGADDVHFDSVKVTLKDKTFTLEIADTDAKRELGLMNRDSMPADHGMLFIFDTPDKVSFWMKNTKIALDLVYVDENGKVTSIHPLKPLDETLVDSAIPVKFAIELNAGAAKTLGLKTGDIIALPEKYLKTKPHPDDK